MQKFLSITVLIYITFSAFESVIRYGLNLIHLDELIFVRDTLIVLGLLSVFIPGLLRHKIHPAFYIYAFVIALHGLIMWENFHNLPAVAYGAKVFLSMLAGAVAAPALFNPTPKTIRFLLLMWLITVVGVVLDKYFVDFPWVGMQTTIGDQTVDISRDWQITGIEKRAGGFMRSSINAAYLEPLLALVLMFHLKRRSLKWLVALMTVPMLYWTTQKGSLLAYSLVLLLLAIAPGRQMGTMRLCYLFFLILMIAMPLALPGYHMPNASGQFSMMSFNLRVEEMWPQAWDWIHRQELFPFGVGLGGIGGAMRLYTTEDMNSCDNMYVFLYGYFGFMALIYLGYITILVFRTYREAADEQANQTLTHALATLTFLIGYGCVLSIPEDQMGGLFFGGSVATLASAVACRVRRHWNTPPDLPAVPDLPRIAAA